MSTRFRINSLIILVLAGLFYFFFMAAKHDPALSAVNAFAEDPYDAIGSFGIQAAAFTSILALIRAFRPYRGVPPTDEQKASLARTQMLAVLAVAVTLAADLEAMARYPRLWTGSPPGYQLVALLSGLVLFTIVCGALTYRSVRGIGLPAVPNAFRTATLVTLATIVVLALYPSSWNQSTPGALLTVVIGALLLFAPMWAWGRVLLPYRTDVRERERTTMLGWLERHKYHLGAVVLIGILIGLCLVLAESIVEGGGPHLAGLAFIALIYVGLETAGLLIGYGFLGRPLGLFRRDPSR